MQREWYQSVHDEIIERAFFRKLAPGIDGFDRHHICPKSLGGSNDETNLVWLTYREHFLVHWLLTKLHTGKARTKMLNALVAMSMQGSHGKRTYSSWQYEIARRAAREYRKTYRHSKEAREHISKGLLGRKHSELTKQKMRETAFRLGKRPPKKSPEQQEKNRQRMLGNKFSLGIKRSEASKAKQREWHKENPQPGVWLGKGHLMTAGHRAKLAKATRRNNFQRRVKNLERWGQTKFDL